MENPVQNQRQSVKGFELLFNHHELYIMKLNVNDFNHFVGNKFFVCMKSRANIKSSLPPPLLHEDEDG